MMQPELENTNLFSFKQALASGSEKGTVSEEEDFENLHESDVIEKE